MPRDNLPATTQGATWRRRRTVHVLPDTLREAAGKGSRLRLRLTRLMAVCILAIFCLGTAYWTNTHPLVEKSLFIVGIAVASFGAAGRAWATAYISGRKFKHLVTTGPYSLCRNPLYFFSLILGIGFGLCTKTFTAPLVIVVVLGILSFYQIRREEQRLRQQFGTQFESYLATIPRFFPSFRNYTEPEEISISPRLLKKGLFGIAFLLILIGALELIQGVHQSGFLPTLFHIY
jgi:protein-S-isoprenylcysteine O-methyltransferase Ste14